MASPRTPEPSPAAVRQAWARMTSPARPATLEAALADPVWSVCLLAMAKKPQPTHWPQVGAYPRQAPVRMQRVAPPAVDRKRLAANDRDD